MFSSELIIALISAAVGGIGTKLIDAFIQRRKRTSDTTADIRSELWLELERLQEENERLIQSLDEQVKRYFILLEKLNQNKLILEQMKLEAPPRNTG